MEIGGIENPNQKGRLCVKALMESTEKLLICGLYKSTDEVKKKKSRLPADLLGFSSENLAKFKFSGTQKQMCLTCFADTSTTNTQQQFKHRKRRFVLAL